jgi:hypothetical protein
MCCPGEGDRGPRRGVRVTVVSTISTEVADELQRKAGIFTDLSPLRLSRVCVDDFVCGAVRNPFNWQTEATPHRLELRWASPQ